MVFLEFKKLYFRDRHYQIALTDASLVNPAAGLERLNRRVNWRQIYFLDST
jgi:hypothetical protein